MAQKKASLSRNRSSISEHWIWGGVSFEISQVFFDRGSRAAQLNSSMSKVKLSL